MFNSIRTRLIFAFASLAITPVLVTALVLSWQSYEALKAEAIDHRHADSERVGVAVEAYINELTHILQLTSQAHDFMSRNLATKKQILEELLAYENRFEEIALVKANGQEIIRIHRIDVVFPKDLNNRSTDSTFKSAISSNSTTYSPITFHPVSGEPYMVISIPLQKFMSPEISHVVMGTIRLKKIWNLVAAKAHSYEVIVITDCEGTVISHPDPSITLTRPRFNLNGTMDGIGKGLDGKPVVYAVNKLHFGDQSFNVIAFQPVEIALAFANDIYRISFIVTLIALLFAILIAIAIIGNIVKPLQKLTHLAHSIQLGNLEAKANADRSDEVGELGKAFNEMTLRLKTTIHSLEHEVEERQKAEEDKVQLEQRLRHAHKMEAIGTMAGGIAHDFNNILAAILGFAELVKSDLTLSKGTSEKVQQIIQAGTRAKDLVKHILTFSRMSLLKKNFDVIDLPAIIEEVITFQRSVVPATISIDSVIDVDQCRIRGDATQIHQILVNLITNAAQAMEEKGGTLKISLVCSDDIDPHLKESLSLSADKFVVMSVEDSGCGVPSNLVDRIFDPYFTTKEVGKGSGMGLSVVHGLVSNHNGSIKVESEPGQGSKFTIAFPAIEEEVTNSYGLSSEKAPSGIETVLFVDDEPSLTALADDMLGDLGYRVVTCNDPVYALKLFQEDPSRIDLVITDQTMPDMTGCDLANELLSIRPDLPIILCTGYSSRVDESTAYALGIKGYTLKPIERVKFAQLIRNVIDQTPGEVTS